jgi:predicted transcriptional regulator of viral defense system
VRVLFVARKNAAEVPTRAFPTPRGEVRVSTPEATAVDLVAYPQYGGGLEEVALALLGLAETIDPARLADAAALGELPWAQRLGYLLDRVGATSATGPLAEYVASRAPTTTLLDPRSPKADAPRDARWRVSANADV